MISKAICGQSYNRDVCSARLGFVEGKNGKPHIVVTSAFHVWIGNPHDNDGLNVQSQELFGFGLGEYEEKEIRCLVQFLELTLFTMATHFCHAIRV